MRIMSTILALGVLLASGCSQNGVAPVPTSGAAIPAVSKPHASVRYGLIYSFKGGQDGSAPYTGLTQYKRHVLRNDLWGRRAR